MARAVIQTFFGITLLSIGAYETSALTIDTATVYDEPCPREGCEFFGFPLVVVNGEYPPTLLEFVEPGFLATGAVPPLPPVPPQLNTAPAVGLLESSIMNMSGGQIFAEGYGIYAADQSSLDMRAGSVFGWGGISAVDSATVNVSGGSVAADADLFAALFLDDHARGVISGGVFHNGDGPTIVTAGNAMLTITDNDFIAGPTRISGNSVVTVRGGSFGVTDIRTELLTITENGTLNILGGRIENVSDIYPPYFEVDARDRATVNVFGTGLALTDHGEGLGIRLTGVLSDGTPIDVGVNGNIVLHEPPLLLPGDANRDLAFDMFDLVQVQQAGKYLSGAPATWGEGDWDAAPGGTPGMPPPGDGVFDQKDIVAALIAGVYLTGVYAAIQPGGRRRDDRASIIYDAKTGEVAVEPPAGREFTSVNIDSAAWIFVNNSECAWTPVGGAPAGDECGDLSTNLFAASFVGGFGSFSFGDVAERGLTEQFLFDDLTVIGSLAGGDELGEVDLIYVPEPTFVVQFVVGWLVFVVWSEKRRARRKLKS